MSHAAEDQSLVIIVMVANLIGLRVNSIAVRVRKENSGNAWNIWCRQCAICEPPAWMKKRNAWQWKLASSWVNAVMEMAMAAVVDPATDVDLANVAAMAPTKGVASVIVADLVKAADSANVVKAVKAVVLVIAADLAMAADLAIAVDRGMVGVDLVDTMVVDTTVMVTIIMASVVVPDLTTVKVDAADPAHPSISMMCAVKLSA